MKDLLEKIKLIYLPFLIIAISFISIYTFLHWFLFIKFELFPAKEMFLKFWLPCGIPCILVYLFLSPRLKNLKFKNDNKSFFFHLMAVVVIAIPTMIAQEYLITATGKLTPLETISEIPKHEKTKYYTLQKFYIDKKNIGVLNTGEATGKNNERFNMLIYVAMPILKTAKETSKHECKYWLGKRYSEEISNSLSNGEKQIRFKDFAARTEKEFNNTDFNQFTYLELVGNTEDHDNFNSAIEQNTHYDLNKPFLLIAHDEPFKNRNGKKLEWVLGALGIGLLFWFILIFFTKLQPQSVRNLRIGKKSKLDSLKDTFDFLMPREDFYITPILINLNLFIFILMVCTGFGLFTFKGKDLLDWGANFRPFVEDGQWWRLLTSVFLHGGIMHLVSNMFGLYIVGLFLEPLLGKAKYLIIYLVTGIFASLASIWWHDATVSVGASGAIFGLYGLFIALSFRKVFSPLLNKAYLVFGAIFVGYNLLMGLFGNIDNAAHIGGLISGFVIGCIIASHLREQKDFDDQF
ncbi:membrane associated rhomboid family serine protease [Flavobacterium sp. 9]|uniref:rhomboid family intramembrane serine protease n=1 Tax=Flavobacterium sp. 9 TaxID=2035198 RepID=UPI000C1A7313|nr:rhomboid family intramembrane serine protease [Flavobacterium sp. 9]PIF31274.1 membrane associated rhomboid family serine protease [Flavobacterium sp. 9]